MSGKVILLAALHEAPRERSFVVAGTETINLHGRLQTVPFSHTLIKPELLKEVNAKPGDALYIEANVSPITGQPGRVLIIPRHIRVCGPGGVEKDNHGKYVLVGGINHMLVSGTVARAPSTELFAYGQQATTLHLTTDTRGGELTVVAYGLLAAAAATLPAGHFSTLQGRLTYDTRTDPLGRTISSALVEVARADATPPRAPREKKKPRPAAQAAPTAPTDAARPPASEDTKRSRKKTAPATPSTPTEPGAPTPQATTEGTPAPAPTPASAPAPVQAAAPTPPSPAPASTRPPTLDRTVEEIEVLNPA